MHNLSYYIQSVRYHQRNKKERFTLMTDINITLTKTEKDDLDAFFQFQLDNEANYLAAFTAKDPNDKAAYIEKYSKFLTDPTINMRTIKANDEIVGSVSKFIMQKEARLRTGLTENFGGSELPQLHLPTF